MATDVSGCIRSKIASGLLPIPTVPPGEMWVGKGSGRSCNVCDQPIREAGIEYETDLPTGKTLRFMSSASTRGTRSADAARPGVLGAQYRDCLSWPHSRTLSNSELTVGHNSVYHPP